MAFSTPNPAEKLAEERDAAKQLIHVLKEEREQLVKANIDALPPLIGQKTALIVRMTELGKARMNALAKAGYAAEEDSMQKWLDAMSSGTTDKVATQDAWNELHGMIRSAKELNRTNGLLIGSHMSRNQVALQVLQSNQAGQVYGPNGQTSVQTSSRSVIVG